MLVWCSAKMFSGHFFSLYVVSSFSCIWEIQIAVVSVPVRCMCWIYNLCGASLIFFFQWDWSGRAKRSNKVFFCQLYVTYCIGSSVRIIVMYNEHFRRPFVFRLFKGFSNSSDFSTNIILINFFLFSSPLSNIRLPVFQKNFFSLAIKSS